VTQPHVAAPQGRPLVEVRGVSKSFAVRSASGWGAHAVLRAVDGVDLEIAAGETLGLVGESGSGKSTLGRLIGRLLEPSAGSIHFDGHDLAELESTQLRRLRREFQMIFQDPHSSLDPRATIADSLSEPLQTHLGLDRAQCLVRSQELLERVGLEAEHLWRRPHQFSGGQLQRIAIARALSVEPRLIVCDEPVSALDVSTQAQIVNLLRELQAERQISYLFISHDLSIVRHMSHRIAVMYLGQIVEAGDANRICTAPKHPYTEALLASVPVPRPRSERPREPISLGGDVPSPIDPPSGCHFHPRCPHALALCRREAPQPLSTAEGERVSCHLHTPSGVESRGGEQSP